MCDFAPGDVVVCVDAARRFHPNPMLNPGQTYVVVSMVTCPDTGKPGVVLDMPLPPGILGWQADRFRRVYRPDGSLIAGLLQPVKEHA